MKTNCVLPRSRAKNSITSAPRGKISKSSTGPPDSQFNLIGQREHGFEARWPSSVRGKIIAAIICSICVIHSPAALSGDPQDGPWTNLYGCAKKDTTRKIGEASILFCVPPINKPDNRKNRSKAVHLKSQVEAVSPAAAIGPRAPEVEPCKILWPDQMIRQVVKGY